MLIFCCGCELKIEARLTNGKEIYPHLEDLHELPFWKCDKCNLYVGCHHKTKNRTHPLGNIPTKELRNARNKIHEILDPIHNKKILSRSELYNKISEKIGWKYHTAKIKSIEEARNAYKIILNIKKETTKFKSPL